MPLAEADLDQITEIFERLFEKKFNSSARHKQEGQADSALLSDREILERILSIEGEIKVLHTEIKNIHIELKNQRELIEKILHQFDKRFEQTDKRFEQVDKRFEELREDMNRRFEQVDKRFNQLFWFIGLFIPLSNSLLLLGLSYVLGLAK